MSPRNWGPEVKLPERYSSIIDAVCGRDREYFQQHPQEKQYIRDYIPGEFWPRNVAPEDVPRCKILVKYVTDDVRIRVIISAAEAGGHHA